jgi:hypothetical protein
VGCMDECVGKSGVVWGKALVDSSPLLVCDGVWRLVRDMLGMAFFSTAWVRVLSRFVWYLW